MARAIAEGNGFALGTASLTGDGTAAFLPVFRTRVRPRAYVLASEVADSVLAVDPGRIDRLRVENEASETVFLPPGSLFEGKETASRGTIAGVFLEPETTVELDVRCVHPSRPVLPGAPLHLTKLHPPDAVRRVLLSKDQGLVWSVIRDVAAPSHSDDLIAALGGAGAGREADAGIEASSSCGEQCGLVRLDVRGVVTVEVSDSPESWTAFEAMTSRRDQHPSSRTMARHLSIAPDRAATLAKDFLLDVGKREIRHATPYAWTTVDCSAACAVLGGESVHLLAFRGPDPWTEAALDAASPVGQPTTDEAIYGARLPISADTTVKGGPEEGDVVVAAISVETEDPEAGRPIQRPRRRKVLSSGWDSPIFESLERYSRKEFGGDRSAAMRFLVRQGLQRRGYMGPHPPPPQLPVDTSSQREESPQLERGRAAVEARIRDFERIATTDAYAEWLRERARSELERMASSEPDEGLRATAQTALDRAPIPPPIADLEDAPEEIAPPPPPMDLRPLLRRAFSASAAGQYADALRLLDEVLQAEPTHRTALLGRAVALRRSGKAPEALAALDLVLRLEPTNAAALLNRGRVLQEMGDLRGSLETLDRLAAVAPNDWDVWVARGDVLARMGLVHDALAAYAGALHRNPDDDSLNAKIRALERARPPPPPSPAARAALPREIQEGQSYLVKEPRPDLCYRMLRSLLVRSVPVLVIARKAPSQILAEHALQGAAVLQLTHEPGDGHVAPTDLPYLTAAAERFILENHGRAAILLDGLRFLVESNGFRETALFIERVNEAVLPSHATFFVSMAPGDLGEKEAAILERDLRVLS